MAVPRIGPNIFAIPVGQIVVFEKLVALAENDDQVVAVLANELCHVKYCQGMRKLFQGAVVSVVTEVWIRNISSLAAGLGPPMLESRCPREFEREADRYAEQRLCAACGNAELLFRMLEWLEEAHDGVKHGDTSSVLDLCLEAVERIRALRGEGGSCSCRFSARRSSG